MGRSGSSALVPLVTLCLVGCDPTGGSAGAGETASTPMQAPTPTILDADEGEKLLMDEGRYVILKTTAEGQGAEGLMMGTEALPHGSAIPVHSHEGYEEIIFIHEGDVVLTLGEREVEASEGTTMFVPPGTWHGVRASGPGQATMLFIFPEPEIAGFFRAVGREEGQPPRRLTAEDWRRIMAEHQMRSRPDSQ